MTIGTIMRILSIPDLNWQDLITDGCITTVEYGLIVTLGLHQKLPHIIQVKLKLISTL